ncbi:AraC family transcriptional regulator [Bacteroides ovatus]|uniref:helix-turn-helix domain-containing protein n=1 Tax=Bacteroides ovatus TaxID=28116 RepID=UPI0021655B2E|nr:AraC family transcriptional regulator [Bacteroides ovatus]MCS2930570.1 AraC family transcriptional regulator [Bacteroides ovatus]
MIVQGEYILDTNLYNTMVNKPYFGESKEAVDESAITEKMKEIYENLLYVFDHKQIYLDAHLNLVKLSHTLFTNTTYLSRVINVYFHCNLKTLLNKYRIDYAKELLKKDECDLRTLPGKCGFLSRSTFYSAFTKFEHITPTAFRARIFSLRLRDKEI